MLRLWLSEFKSFYTQKQRACPLLRPLSKRKNLLRNRPSPSLRRNPKFRQGSFSNFRTFCPFLISYYEIELRIMKVYSMFERFLEHVLDYCLALHQQLHRIRLKHRRVRLVVPPRHRPLQLLNRRTTVVCHSCNLPLYGSKRDHQLEHQRDQIDPKSHSVVGMRPKDQSLIRKNAK